MNCLDLLEENLSFVRKRRLDQGHCDLDVCPDGCQLAFQRASHPWRCRHAHHGYLRRLRTVQVLAAAQVPAKPSLLAAALESSVLYGLRTGAAHIFPTFEDLADFHDALAKTEDPYLLILYIEWLPYLEGFLANLDPNFPIGDGHAHFSSLSSQKILKQLFTEHSDAYWFLEEDSWLS